MHSTVLDGVAQLQATSVPLRSHFVIGSRKSELALWQARAVKGMLEGAFPSLTFEIRTELSLGDKELTSSLSSLASANPGLFTKELEAGLLVSTSLLSVRNENVITRHVPHIKNLPVFNSQTCMI